MEIVDNRTGKLTTFGALDQNDAFIMHGDEYDGELFVKVLDETMFRIFRVATGEIMPSPENSLAVGVANAHVVIEGRL